MANQQLDRLNHPTWIGSATRGFITGSLVAIGGAIGLISTAQAGTVINLNSGETQSAEAVQVSQVQGGQVQVSQVQVSQWRVRGRPVTYDNYDNGESYDRQSEEFIPTIVPPFSFSIDGYSVNTQQSGFYIQNGVPIYIQNNGRPFGRRIIRGGLIEDSTLINPTIINSNIEDSLLVNPTIVPSQPTRVIQTQYLTPGIITPPRRELPDPATLPDNCTAFSDGAIACW